MTFLLDPGKRIFWSCFDCTNSYYDWLGTSDIFIFYIYFYFLVLLIYFLSIIAHSFIFIYSYTFFLRFVMFDFLFFNSYIFGNIAFLPYVSAIIHESSFNYVFITLCVICDTSNPLLETLFLLYVWIYFYSLFLQNFHDFIWQ